MLTNEQAILVAEQARDNAGIKSFSVLATVENRFIEVTESLDREHPGKVRDVEAWIVIFKKGTAWYEFSIDNRDGRIIRQRWSR